MQKLEVMMTCDIKNKMLLCKQYIYVLRLNAQNMAVSKPELKRGVQRGGGGTNFYVLTKDKIQRQNTKVNLSPPPV